MASTEIVTLWTLLSQGTVQLSATQWWDLMLHFAVLSLLGVGGAISTVSDMQRFIVDERGWLGAEVFAGSVALAQAAPGPNVLFVAVIGFQVGGLPGVAATLLGSLVPTTVLALGVARWGQAHRDSMIVRAFAAGLAPVTVGMLAATAWVLTDGTRSQLLCIPVVLLTAWLGARTSVSPLWLVAAGAALGILGWL